MSRSEPVAIVGMGCRFAGAPDLQAYWELTVEGRHAFGPVPADRWDHADFFDANKRANDKSYAPAGAFIDDIRSFPGLALGIPPRRIEVMDPQQRFALEVALQAVHDAGYRPDEMPRRTGVFMGVTASEYRTLMSSRVTARLMANGQLGRSPEDTDALAAAVERVVPSRPYTAPGALGNMIAAIVAQELDFHGPAYTVDAACASAHMAVGDAVAQLRSGQIDAAIAGGVYICVSPDHHVAFSRIGAMSASGVCRPFDADADGFVQGDGAGVVVLKRLADATRDGDRIYAVIRGVATNNDGRGDGPMAPLESGQTAVIRDAWENAGIGASELGYVETHGTGTDVGDQTELRGLRGALEAGIGRQEAVVLGSSKANVGHTMSAAGIAGIIRSALAIHHRVLPPMANFTAAKPDSGLHGSAFRIITKPEPWAADARIAGVSSFGFGGTNGHVVLSDGPSAGESAAQAELVLISAPDERALRDLAGAAATAIAGDPTATVTGVARAFSVRKPQAARLSIVAADTRELVGALRQVAAGGNPKGAWIGTAGAEPPKVAFLFPGQGSQRIGMLSTAKLRFPVLAETLAQADAHLADLMPVPPTRLLWPDGGDPVAAEKALTATESCQPVLAAVGLALAALLDQVGVKPAIATGHSLGEFVAAAVGGVISPRDAVRFSAQRGRAMADQPGDPGAMLAVMTDRATAESLLVDGAVIANHNHPTQLVLSGTTDAIRQVAAKAEVAGVKHRALDVSHAFHSPLFHDLDVERFLGEIAFHAPAVPVASGIGDRPYASADDARKIFRRHAGSPVDFVGALRQCQEAGADVYLQVGAGGPLASFARGVVEKDRVMTLGSQADDDGGRSILEGLGWLWAKGVDVDVRPILGAGAVSHVPPIVLPREVYWAIKDQPQHALKFGRGAAPVGTAPQPVVDDVQPAAAGVDDVLDRVTAVVAKVSSYPKHAVAPKQSLVDDLGFDSLMVADLATGLADAFPGLGGLPQELLINRPSVQDIADYVRSVRLGGSTGPDDDAPVAAWSVAWRAAPLPAGTPRKAKILGNSAAAVALRAAIGSDDADAVVWVDDLTDRAPLSAVVAGEAPIPDPAGALLAELERYADRPVDLVVVVRSDDPWAEGASAVARTVAREWPDRLVRTVGFAAGVKPAEIAARVGAELATGGSVTDRSVDVRYAGATRLVMGFELEDRVVAAWTPGAGDRVLISGGTRGIGARLAARLADAGATTLLVGRSAPDADAAALVAAGRAVWIQADVTDRAALTAAVAPHLPVTAIVHAAGVLADGALGKVDPSAGARARAVKVDGLVGCLAAAPGARVVLAVGSWAGRLGSRHQSHYAAGNATLAGLVSTASGRGVASEFGPWSGSDMVRTIPAAVQAAMRAEGVDFVGDAAGLDALWADLTGGAGIVVRGRDLPHTTRVRKVTDTLSVATHPYLADHAIEGTPIFPLAAAADLIGFTADLPPPFEIEGLTLFTGITAKEPIAVECVVRGDRAEIRGGERRQLAYRARIRPAHPVARHAPTGATTPSPLGIAEFYRDVTFHGPLLQGLVAVDGLGNGFARGKVRGGTPKSWTPGTDRAAWSVDPLALDSAMQLSAVVAWLREKRGGTPVSIGRLTVLAPLPPGDLHADVTWATDAAQGDRFVGTLALRDADGTLLLLAEDTAAELRKKPDAVEEAPPLVIKREWVDFSSWSAVKDLKIRLEMAAAVGLRNPYFAVHEGTARNTTRIGDRELVNFSSYNYIGLSGDSRVNAQVHEAVERYGTSVSASRVASGERPFHRELERELAASQGAEDALVFTAGHATNVTTIGHLMGKADLILHDELIHDSLLQGIRLAGSGRRGFRHDDPDHLEQILKEMRGNAEKCLIAIEGVYSMDGDIANLPRYIELKKKYGCLLMVDEAHSYGVIGKTGRGAGEHFGIDGREVDIWMGTLSKSLSSCGGWIAGSADLITYLRYTAPGFIFSAGLTAANGVAALASLRLMLDEPWRVHRLQANSARFYQALTDRGVDTGPARGRSGVIPAITHNSLHALVLSGRLNDEGVNVQPIVYPAVADNAARLRFFLSSTHTDDELDTTAEKVARLLAAVQLEMPSPTTGRRDPPSDVGIPRPTPSAPK